MKKNSLKIGILGGTFDPPHYGHIEISRIAIKKLKLKKIFWIITKQNPLKAKPKFDLISRIKLCKKILKNQKKIEIRDLGKKISSLNTYSLLKYISRKNKKIKIFFLIGSDNLINFHKWKNWRKIPQLAKIVVFARPGYSNRALTSIASKKLDKRDWLYINITNFNISSTKLKKI